MSLSENISNLGPMPVKQFMALGISITEDLDRLHKTNQFHRNICPQNIVCDPDTLKAELVDISSRPSDFSIHPASLRAYISRHHRKQSMQKNIKAEL